VTVSARSANDLPAAANLAGGDDLVDMRAGSAVLAGTFRSEGADFDTTWHTHDLHQLEYALEGVVELETRRAHYLLPPQQAVWVPAGLLHRTTVRRAHTVSVFFDTRMVPDVDGRARVLAALPVMREMIVYGARWPIDRASSDAVADAFFDALAHLVVDWLEHERPLSLPTSSDPVVGAVMSYTNEHLDTVSARDVCRAVGVSERTLRRQFVAATAMTWREYTLHARLLRAMTLLAEPGPTVLDVATRVGFDSVSAFTRAFSRYSGETPTAYRRRVSAGGSRATAG
jgi:AraC-like DNA-binding protein